MIKVFEHILDLIYRILQSISSIYSLVLSSVAILILRIPIGVIILLTTGIEIL
nr:MAG TPA: hypothetical protein [Bacteriophage sp.]